jgi:fused signal recognition particle receptor
MIIYDYILIGASALLTLFIFINFATKSEATPSVEERPVEAVKKVAEKPKVSWSDRLLRGLEKTRNDVWGKVRELVQGSALDEQKIEEIEEILYTSDISPVLIAELIDELKKIPADQDDSILPGIKDFFKGKMHSAQEKTLNNALFTFDKNNHKDLKVVMIVGVNGAGKTTTIGKLATKLKEQGANVVVGACDTFRAAAVEQLEVWCKRADVDIVKSHDGADPSAVAFDTVKLAKEKNADYCIIDTAGRLHTKSNLMDELKKTKRVMSKVDETAPHEVLLVVDAITGQNAIKQAEEFNQALELSGLIFTKCDGSAKAGSAVSIVDKLQVPITYIGVGEGVEDLDRFDLDEYLQALLGA